jgi:hypothetical protein
MSGRMLRSFLAGEACHASGLRSAPKGALLAVEEDLLTIPAAAEYVKFSRAKIYRAPG